MLEFDDFEPIGKLLGVAVKEQDNENDSCFLVVGKEGVGKSNFILDCVEWIRTGYNKKITIENICPDLERFILALDRNKGKAIIVLDEGRKLAGISHFEKLSRAFVEAYTIMRKKAFITFIAFTNPMKIQSYFREDRIRGLFFIKKRGVVYYYSINQLLYIIPELQKKQVRSINAFAQFKPRFIAHFPKYEGELKDDYDKMKDENIDLVLHRLKEDFVKEKIYSLNKASLYVGINAVTLKRFIDSGELKADKTLLGGKYRITENELILFKNKVRDNPQKYQVDLKSRIKSIHPHLFNKEETAFVVNGKETKGMSEIGKETKRTSTNFQFINILNPEIPETKTNNPEPKNDENI